MTIDIDLKDTNLAVPQKSREKIKNVKREKLPTNGTTPKKNKRKKIIILVIVTLVLLGLGFLIYKGYIFSHDLGFRLRPEELLGREEKSLKKDPSGKYTNVLLVGLDTRENTGLLNTDTIMMASYNYETNDITLLSIPRDFHVEVEEGVNWYVRINSIYNVAEQEKQGTGIIALQDTVERVTGQKIQYYAMVDFKAFVGIIDTLGGIDVNVENSFTDYRYPLGKGYQTVSFEAGPQTMDGETALIYSRSRHSLQNNEGSDFARAKRQQKVIIALKDKLLSSESLMNPKTILGILPSIDGNIRVSEFSTNDIEAALELFKEFNENSGKIYSFVLDTSIGNYSLVENKPMESGAYAIGPKIALGDYTDINEFVGLIMTNPALYGEKAKVLIYDTGAGYQTVLAITEKLNEGYPYLDITFAGTLRTDREEIIIYSHEEGENSHTVRELSKYLETDLTTQPDYITSNLNGEDVTILIGSNIRTEEE
ncbi:MAG TPA: LCP family protein [Candidatus Dojkabacteria bacterium]|nr:LCP family protein [Candidatus Dojkabacteria bacterium]